MSAAADRAVHCDVTRRGPQAADDFVDHDRPMAPRLNLILPTIEPAAVFGGVTTALDIFLLAAARTGSDVRIILDDFNSRPDRTVLDSIGRRFGLEPEQILLLPRIEQSPRR